MTPEALAAMHAAAFRTERPWSAAEFTGLLSSPHVAVYTAPNGFALTRSVAGESELLTLAVPPAHQRKGIAAALVRDWLGDLPADIQTAFLEVAADNAGAIALYERAGFFHIATRNAYYDRKATAAVDALIYRRVLTKG